MIQNRLIVLATSMAATVANANTIVYQTGLPDSFFSAFDSATPAGTKFGESGYVSGGSAAPLAGINSITLGLVTYSPSTSAIPAGKTDIVFTFNHGDPSGLVFGLGTQIYSVTIPDVTLPAVEGTFALEFDLPIALPGLALDGGFNNLGWSVGVENFDFQGELGFQNKGAFNNVGFISGNASEFTPGVGWSLFAFGPAFPADSANFVATITVPEPVALTSLAGLALVALRRRSSVR